MDTFPKLYSQITLVDGRKGIVVDRTGDDLVVDIGNSERDWDTIFVTMVGTEFYPCIETDDEAVYTLCHRKEIRLYVSDSRIYTFVFGNYYNGDSFSFTSEQYRWLCNVLSIDENKELQKSWNDYFEYHSFYHFRNAYHLVVADDFYYAYGYDAEEKTADALYRIYEGRFERYFPMESVWREMPEQRMILSEKKPRYQRVSEVEGMNLALLK